jgi:hypothetical protein
MSTSETRPNRTPLVAAWAIVLLTSSLPMVILQEFFGMSLTGDQRALISLGALLAAAVVVVAWRPLRPLMPMVFMFTVLIGAQWLVYTRLDTLPFFKTWLANPSFNYKMFAEQMLNLCVTVLMVGGLFVLGKRPATAFLLPGDLKAPAAPIRWLGIKASEPWNKLGLWMAFFISLGLIAFLVIAGKPPLDIVVRALPFLPMVLVCAALNAFTEEVNYKASFLSVLEAPFGRSQALMMVAAYFGLGHFYGVPYGVVGVLMAGLMGWLLARSMVETRGLFWAWFIHFWQDVWIFSFLAIGSILPGGG